MAEITRAQRELAKAITQLICTYPFFATIVLRLKRRVAHAVDNYAVPGPCPCPPELKWPECPHSMATDGVHLFYNPRFVENLTLEENMGVLAHEVLHVAGLHPLRRGTRQPAGWNYATDAVINGIIAECGLRLPAGGVPGVKNKTPEELYQELPEVKVTMRAAGVKGDQGNQPYTGFGDILDPKNDDGSGLTDAQRGRLEAETKIMVQQAHAVAKAAGKLPAGLARMLDEALEPRVPWKELLARFIDGQARNDYTWIHPNRRYLAGGVMLPSLRNPGYGRVVLGCDTSGSIDQEQLREICSELLGCLAAYEQMGQPTELDVAWFDHAVYPQVVSEPEELKPQGGGGTSFRIVFDWMREQQVDARAVIMVTDGYCHDYGAAPDCPVLWVLTHVNHTFKPEFGELCCTLNN